MVESGVQVGSVVGFGKGSKGQEDASKKLKVWLAARPGTRVIEQKPFTCACILPDGRIVFNTVLSLKYQTG